MKISEQRHQKYIDLANRRQNDLTVILENIADVHNVGAILRSCDAIGIGEVFMLNTMAELQNRKFALGKRTTAGARKWVQVHYFESLDLCFSFVRKKYKKIFTTHISEHAQTSVYDLNLVEPTALLFGNERKGVTEAALQGADGNFLIPQVGMVESLNVSVACAVTLFEAQRQRRMAGKYSESKNILPEAIPFYEKLMEMHRTKQREMPIIFHTKKSSSQ